MSTETQRVDVLATKRKNMRTLDSACTLSFRQLRRNQETLSYTDRVRYWRAFAEHCAQELEDAEAELNKLRAARVGGAS